MCSRVDESLEFTEFTLFAIGAWSTNVRVKEYVTAHDSHISELYIFIYRQSSDK